MIPKRINDFFTCVINGEIIKARPKIIPAIGANKSFLLMGMVKYLLIISDNTSSIYRLFRQNQIT